MMLVQLALRELWGSRRHLGVPALALSLAVAALFILGAFQFRMNEMIRLEGRETMGADFRVDATRPLSTTELESILEFLPDGATHARITDFNTMLRFAERSRFVRLHAVSSNFPLYGSYETEPSISFQDLDDELAQVVLPAEVVDFFNLSLGDELQIGDKSFRYTALLKSRPGRVSGFASFAPTIYIHERHLEATGLFDLPGRVDYENYFRTDSERPVDELVESVESLLNDPFIRVRSFEGSNRGFQRIYSQFQLFGHLIALVGLLLASLSIFGSLQTWFQDRRYLIAILRCSGASAWQVRSLILLASICISLSASFLGLLLGWLTQYFLSPWVASYVPILLSVRLPFELFLASLVIGVFVTSLFGLLTMAKIEQFKPIILIRNQESWEILNWQRWGFIGLLILSFFVLTIYLIGDFKQSLYLSLGLVFSLILAAGTSFLLFYSFSKFRSSSFFLFSYAKNSLLRKPGASLINSSLLFLVSFLLVSMLILEGSLQDEFRVDPQMRQSTLMIFDLGEEDKEVVDDFLSQTEGASAVWAPWVSLRWMTHNDRAPDLDDEDGGFRQELRVSVADELEDNNRVVSGEIWTQPYESGLVEVSVSRGFALRKGISIGDRLGFKLYGVDFEAEVTSFRQIRFTDFQPFFRFIFQPGYFEGLPFSYLASIETESDEVRRSLLSAFTKEFPQYSIIDLSEAKTDLSRITEKISLALFFVLGFLLLLTLSMMLAFAREKVQEKRKEFAMLKAVGADRNQLRGLLAFEFSYLSILPTTFGALLGVLAGNLILREFFGIYVFHFSWPILFVPPLLSSFVLGVGLLTARYLLRIKPRLLLADT